MQKKTVILIFVFRLLVTVIQCGPVVKWGLYKHSQAPLRKKSFIRGGRIHRHPQQRFADQLLCAQVTQISSSIVISLNVKMKVHLWIIFIMYSYSECIHGLLLLHICFYV
jgi:hypothetical protein